MNKGIVIQARLGSTRLPGKMLMPFYKDESLLGVILKRLKSYFQDIDIVVATTDSPKDDKIELLCKQLNLEVYRGSEDDVLSRFIDVAEKFGFDTIVRVCADNPFILPEYIQNLIDQFDESKTDYLSYQFENQVPVIKSHIGLFAEVVSLRALKKVKEKTDNPFYFEHVTNYIYGNPHDFTVDFIDLPVSLHGRHDIRLTVDTINDFNLVQELYNDILENGISIETLISKIDSDVRYKSIMLMEIEKQKK